MAAGAAEVSVDRETGAVTVEHYASVADIGRAINPLACEGQDEGAVMQGSATRSTRRWSTRADSS